MGGSNTSTQTTSAGPWKPTQKHLKGILGEAERLFDKNKGFKPYPDQAWVNFSPETEQALSQMTGLAGQPNPFYAGAQGFTSGLIGGDYSLDPSRFEALGGRDAITVNPQLQALLGNTASALDQYGRPIASGAEGIDTEGNFRDLYSSIDPEFEKVVQSTADTLGDQISRQFGGASFGSAAHTGAIADQVGDVVSRMRSNNFQQNLANKSNILGNITGIQGQNIQNRLGAAGALSGEQAGALGQQAGILGQIGGFEGGNADFQRGIAGDIANLEGQDIQNRLAGLGMADSVYNSQFLPSQMLAGVGAAREGKAGEELQAAMDKWNIKQQTPFEQLLSYFGIATGTGAQGNRTTSTVSQPNNPLSSILGGGLLASQMFL